jgi:hypothetical protein
VGAMDNFLQKVYNYYLYFLNRLQNGNSDHNYKNLFTSILLIKYNITDPKLRECFSGKLFYPYSITSTVPIAQVPLLSSWGIGVSPTNLSIT